MKRRADGPLLEAKRVLKPHGVLIAAFLNRYELFRYAASRDPHLLHDEADAFESMLADWAGALQVATRLFRERLLLVVSHRDCALYEWVRAWNSLTLSTVRV